MIRIDVDSHSVLDAFNELIRRVESPRQAMQEIGDTLADTTRLRFRAGEGPDGTPWHPLAESTLLARGKRAIGARKRSQLRAGGNGTVTDALSAMLSAQPLLDTGVLRNSIAVAVGADYVEVGTVEPHGEGSARIHQFGGQAGRGKKVTIPARPFLGLSASDEAMVLDILGDYFSKAFTQP